MKTSLLLVLAIGLGFFTILADAFEIPSAVLTKHQFSCPEFTSSERSQYLTRESYLLPSYDGNDAHRSTLYLLGCEKYAYNSLQMAYIIDSLGYVSDVSIVEVSSDGTMSATTNLMGSGFDLDTLTLGTFQKGRGMGDCGSSAVYKFDLSLERFILVEARLKNACDGEESEWPIVYKK